jgi:D-amino-acid oxidase
MWTVFDAPIEETGVLSDGTNKIWYDQLVGGLKELSKEQLPKDAVFGIEFPTTFRINTAVYLQWQANMPILFKMQNLMTHQAPNRSPRQRHQIRPPTLHLPLIHPR